MSRKTHYANLESLLKEYANYHSLTFHRYSPYHMRIFDEGTVCFDVWTTGKYYVKETNYNLLPLRVVERAGEKGELIVNKKSVFQFLNRLFYPIDFM